MGSSEKQPLADHPNQMQLGMWQLWRSLPRPCKLFLVVSVLQAFVSGAFAVQQLAKVGSPAPIYKLAHHQIHGPLRPNLSAFSYTCRGHPQTYKTSS